MEVLEYREEGVQVLILLREKLKFTINGCAPSMIAYVRCLPRKIVACKNPTPPACTPQAANKLTFTRSTHPSHVRNRSLMLLLIRTHYSRPASPYGTTRTPAA